MNFLKSYSDKNCCVPGCATDQEENKSVLHRFPNPVKNKELFDTWVSAVGGDILSLTSAQIYQNRRVCRSHFENKHLMRNSRITNIAVPTLNMPVTNRQVEQENNGQETIQVAEAHSCSQTTQEFYINVNSQGEILPHQYVVQNEVENNVFSNNYLIQNQINTPTTSTLQITSVSASQVENIKVEETNETLESANQQENNLTEITLSDSDWKLLEEKGWVLLEFDGKIFVLDPLGLHDISDDQQLINELQNETFINANPVENKMECENDNKMEICDVQDDSKKDIVHTKENISKQAEMQYEIIKHEEASNIIVQDKPKMILKLQTKLELKDLPNKIILGETLGGKKLALKIVSTKKAVKSDTKEMNKADDDTNKVITGEPTELNLAFDKYLQKEDEVKCNANDLKQVETVIKQLLTVPATREPLLDKNVLVSKVVKSTYDNGFEVLREHIFVTGRVLGDRNENVWNFVHVPTVISDIRNYMSQNTIKEKNQDLIMHVHIIENIDMTEQDKEKSKPNKTSIMFTKQRIPATIQKRPGSIHACAACASFFKTNVELQQHRENHCNKIIEERRKCTTFVMKKKGKDKNTLKLDKPSGTTYTCVFCKAEITKRCYRKHLTSHIGIADDTKLYKCSMCASTYVHPITLSKHIMTHFKSLVKDEG